MSLTPESILNAHKAQLETLFGLTQKAFDGVEKLVELNLSASRAAVTDVASHSQQLLGAKNAEQLLALQAQFLQPLAEKTAAYSRSLYEIANDTGVEFTQAVEARAAEAQKNIADLLDSTSKNAPAGTETAAAVIKNAAESVQKAVKQASDMAQANLQAVSRNVAEAVKSNTQKN